MKSYSILILLGLLLIIILSSAGCDKSQSKSNPNPLLVNCWTNAFEEQNQEGILIYRPCATHTFPAARYRDNIKLNENDEAEYSVLAPDDAHHTDPGTWSFDSQTKILLIKSKENVVVKNFQVIEITEDLLKVKSLQ